MLHDIDTSVISFLNGYARSSWSFDYVMHAISGNNLLKGGILSMALWWFWFRREERREPLRERVVAAIVASITVLFVARAMALTLPFRLRPLHDPDLHFVLPYTVNRPTLESWSSFPSDHASMFFALAIGIFFMSRKIGAVALLYVLVVICFPRVYLGLHYPTDIAGGALAGMSVAWLANTEKIRKYMAECAMRWSREMPGAFYAGFFFLTYQISTMFESIRSLSYTFYVLLRGAIA